MLNKSERRILYGYAIVVSLAVIPSVLLRVTSSHYVLPVIGIGRYHFVIFSISIAFMIAMSRPLYLVFNRHPNPTSQLLLDIKQHWRTLLAMGVMLVAVPETLDAATQFKKIIPQIQPFYLDPYLVEFERQLFGMDAWQVTHAILGPAATRAIDLIYGLWHLVNISVLCWICLTPDRRFQLQAGISYQLAWLVLGAVLATMLSSVGPCFYEHFFGRADFVPLLDRLHEIGGEDGLHSLTAMNYLLVSSGTDSIGGGISAMPSLHVAIATLTVLIVRDKYSNSVWPTVLTVSYTLTIFVGSVHLGWHYVLDGIAGAVGMLIIWLLVKAGLRLLLPNGT
jgi:hypothetical protein